MAIEPYYQTQYGVLYYGDCFDILPHLEQQATILLTDPMTGQGANTKGKSSRRGSTRKLKGTLVENRDWEIMDDTVPFNPAPWLGYQQIILWGANHFSNQLPKNPKWIIWDKRGKETNRDDNADCEMAWTNLRGVSRVFHHLWKGVCRAGEENVSRQGAKFHPFQKPTALIAFCLRQFDIYEDSVVLDPFGGSGTTAVVCERLNIPWICIEIEQHFCDTTVDRLVNEVSQMTMF